MGIKYTTNIIMLTFLLFLCVGQIIEGNQLFTYEQLEDADSVPPIYIEEMENIKFYADTWRIVTRIDLNNYDNEFKHVQSVLINTTKFCNRLNNKNKDNSYIDSMFQLSTGCNESVQRLSTIMKEIEDINSMQLMVPMPKTNTLSKTDGNTYMDEFEKNKQTQAQIVKIVDKHITLIEASINMFKNHEEELQHQAQQLQIQIDNIMALLNRFSLNIEIKGTAIKHLVQEIIYFSTLVVTNFKDKQEVFIETLGISTSDRKHQTLLPTQILWKELDELRNLISSTQMELPFDIDNEPISKFYDIASVKYTVINKQFVLAYVLPLVESTLFTLYKFNPYPCQIKGEMFKLILPDLQYVALNAQKTNYVTMTQGDIGKCYNNGNMILLCEFTSAIISTEQSTSCAINLLTKTELLPDCDYRITNITTEVWLKLQQVNSWLFIFPKRQKITIDCNGYKDKKYASGAGKITIKPECSVKTEYVELKASQEQSNVIYKKVKVLGKMTINWSAILNLLNADIEDNIFSYLLPRVIDHKQSDNLEKNSISIKEINALNVENGQKHQLQRITQDVHIVVYNIIGAIALWMKIKIFKYFKKRCAKRSRIDEEYSDKDVDIDTMT